jgi:hypothetical protein
MVSVPKQDRVMLHHEYRVVGIAKILDCAGQIKGVPSVQTTGRFVEQIATIAQA